MASLLRSTAWRPQIAIISAATSRRNRAIWQARDTRVQSVELREELARRLSEGESIATEARGIVRQQQQKPSADLSDVRLLSETNQKLVIENQYLK